MRYIIGFLVTIGLIILLIILLFSGGGSQKKVPQTGKALDSYASTDAQVRLTIDGPVNIDQKHDQVRITVDNNNATFEQIQGFDGSVVKTMSFAKTQASYSAFLHALEHENFTKGNTDSSLKDERGYCPLNDRYVFEIIQDGKDIERFWSTSCGGTHTYGGNVYVTLQLFQNQIVNYADLTTGLNL